MKTKNTPWICISGRKGTSIKPLAKDLKRNFQIDLMKLDPNTTFTKHFHPDIEWVYVIKGSFSDHRGTFSQGDFILNEPGSSHIAQTKDEGCELVVCWCGTVTY